MRRVFVTGVLTGLLVGTLCGWGLAMAGRRPTAPVSSRSIMPRATARHGDVVERTLPGVPHDIPRNWVPRTFNGRRYWIVPLGDGQVVAVDTTSHSG
ncbi:MAG: hypothetical protein KGQ61_07095 [Planctomycetes bacterium]|nr:hypothetical protein [Planctomycetota bacterium]